MEHIPIFLEQVFGVTSTRTCNPIAGDHNGLSAVTLDQLVSTFSYDPSLIAFAQLCCDPSWNSRSDADFQEFCLQVSYECISKDRPALLQVSNITLVLEDSLGISSLKLALTYNEALPSGRLTNSRGGVVQLIFLGSLRKQVEELLKFSEGLKNDLCIYLNSARWPNDETDGEKNSILLSWYLQWYGIPAPSVMWTAMDKIKPKLLSSSLVPLLLLQFPTTDLKAIGKIDKCLFSSQGSR